MVLSMAADTNLAAKACTGKEMKDLTFARHAELNKRLLVGMTTASHTTLAPSMTLACLVSRPKILEVHIDMSMECLMTAGATSFHITSKPTRQIADPP